jgi:hypothetical protein
VRSLPLPPQALNPLSHNINPLATLAPAAAQTDKGTAQKGEGREEQVEEKRKGSNYPVCY